MESGIVKKSYPLFMIFPAVIIYTIFYIGSIIGSFILAFTDWNTMHIDKISFIGLYNFKLILEEPSIKTSFMNVFIFVFITVIFKLVFSVLAGLLLNMKFHGRNAARAILFMPCILSSLIVGYIFSFIMRPDDGILNEFLRFAGLDFLALNWLGDMNVAIFSICIVDIWMWTGYCTCIVLAGLQSIPRELEDAARIDGGSPFQVFKTIRVPYLRPVINIIVILSIIGGFQIFDLIIAMTRGGPAGATESVNTIIFKNQSIGALGYASAINLMLFLIVLIIIVPTQTLLRKREIET